jgi:[protein-PII] uridylyltransferase
VTLKEVTASFTELRAGLLDDAGLGAAGFCRAYAAAVDRWLADLFEVATAGTAGGGRGVALVAVGGYGRSELCPASDIDVVLLAGGRRERDRDQLRALAEAIWYPVWDTGLKLGHRVWTVKAALELGAGDLETATALLDVRLVAGDPEPAAELAERARSQWRSKSSRWLDLLGRSVAERHGRAGEVAFLLEPDLKEGRGGLRDVHALHWAEAAGRVLLEADTPALHAAYATLLAVRVELHRRAGRPIERLLLQEQDGVAAALGDADADALMARVVQAARTIAWTSDDTWQRVASTLAGPRGRVARRDQPLGPGLVLRDDVVELGPGADPARDGTLVLRAAAAAAGAGTRLSRPALDRLAAEAALPPEPWPEEARRALLRLLGAGRGAIGVLEALDQKGLLVRLVPEWERVRGRPQRNAYHRFTVDRHLCEAAAEAAGFATRVRRPDLLLMGAWLHDIGKGFTDIVDSGDHSEAGAVVVERIATRMGFPPADVAVLADLARHHLLLADAATRRDVDDPVTVETVANLVGSHETLELLHTLTEADSLATGPAAWSRWKAELVAALVARAGKHLAGDRHEASTVSLTPAQRALVERVRAGGEVVVEADGNEVAVAAPDRPGLFYRVAGALTLHGLNVLSARGWSAPEGVAVEEFVVEPVFGGRPDWRRVEADMRRALTGRLSLEPRIAERARTYAGRTPLPSATPPRTLVVVDNDASATATVVEVWAPDRIGALYRVTRALSELDLDIRHAKVATLGHEVVDAFYVVDAAGAKVTDPDHVRELEQALLHELARL